MTDSVDEISQESRRALPQTAGSGASPFAAQQYELARWLTDPEALEHNAAARRFAEQHIAGAAQLRGVERLEIYRQQFWLRHSACLVDDYPGLAGVVGSRNWPRFVEAYLGRHLTDSWTLKDLGSGLVDFIREDASWLPRRDLCLDMAVLETAFTRIFDVPDVPALDPHRLASIPLEAWERARLIFSPAVRLLSFGYPVVELRRRLLEAEAGSKLEFPDPYPELQWVLVYRSAHRELLCRGVDVAEAAVLDELAQGQSLVAAFEAAASKRGRDPQALVEEAQGWLPRWSGLGWIASVDIPTVASE